MAKTPRDHDPITSGPQHESQIVEHSDPAPLTGVIAVPVRQGEKRQHKATYAKDKRNGGYLVRIVGPHANAFGGKIVPVVKRDDSESEESLLHVVWSGIDTGTPQAPGSGKPVALYTFQQKPRGNDEVEF